jgi:hypothetical protein
MHAIGGCATKDKRMKQRMGYVSDEREVEQMLEDYRFNIATCIAVLFFGLLVISAFMFLMTSGMSSTDVNVQFSDMSFYMFVALLFVSSMMLSLEKK